MTGILAALDAPVALLRPKDLDFRFDVVEDGETFGHNAMLKAWGLYELLRGILRPGVTASISPETLAHRVDERFGGDVPAVLSDDSGLCVHALDNGPGIRSARFGDDTDTPPTDDEGRNDLLLQTLLDTDDRAAHYVCNAVLIQTPERYVQVETPWHGEVLWERIPGSTGFGYDPVIWLPEYENSVARIPQEQKDRISHRAQAVGAIMRATGIV
ncbi:MAG: non-canonical purine NTP pyrophosphatase [Spirochaeta sp.]|jgi:XTP/dITP diphosphohydrolase|nr:non-canonical purine NTP pyrophosphatase [Spirochaeta sp.]